jgi:multimeric flavodoxin WrbA
MGPLLEKMHHSDFIVFATPLSFQNVSGHLKVFFDRMTAAGGDPHSKRTNERADKVSSFIMVSSCGFQSCKQFKILSLWIKNVATLSGMGLVGEFYMSSGRMLNDPAPELKEPLGRYLAYLEACGRSIAISGRLDAELVPSLDKDLASF